MGAKIMNEVATKEIDVQVNFTPSKIEVAHKEEMEQAVKAYAKQFDGLVATEENLPDVKKAKAELNRFNTKLTERFREIKKEYTAPLTNFDKWIKSLKQDIQDVIDPLDVAVKEMEKRELQERVAKIQELITEMAEPHGVEVEEVEIRKEWTNKGSFTAKGAVTSKVIKEIAGVMKLIKQDKDRLQGNIEVITNYAKTFDLDPESWIALIEFGQSTPEVMRQIDKAVSDRNARQAREEELKRNEEEYARAMEKLREESLTEVDGQSVDMETGEIVEPKLLTNIIKITGTIEQFKELNDFLIDKGLQVEKVD